MKKTALPGPDLTEALLAKIVGIYLKERGWDLYPEVVLKWFHGRPDYVGVKDALVMALECKKTLSYEVLEQLFRWRGFTEAELSDPSSRKGVPHLLIAASFESKSSKMSELKLHLIKSNRIGYITVRHRGPVFMPSGDADVRIVHCFENQMSLELEGHLWDVRELITAKIQPGSRKTAARLAAQLNHDMKRAVSGLSGKVGGNYMTPFRRTLMKAVAVLEARGECHLQHIVEDINQLHGGHHYSNDASAKQGIAKFLREFGIAESIGGLPSYRLLPDYKEKIYATETASQKIIKEQKAARTAARKIAGKPHFWEENNLFGQL